MEEREKIRVYANIQHGKTVCICLEQKKRCYRECESCIVERDKFFGWEQTFRRNKYGK